MWSPFSDCDELTTEWKRGQEDKKLSLHPHAFKLEGPFICFLSQNPISSPANPYKTSILITFPYSGPPHSCERLPHFHLHFFPVLSLIGCRTRLLLYMAVVVPQASAAPAALICRCYMWNAEGHSELSGLDIITKMGFS